MVYATSAPYSKADLSTLFYVNGAGNILHNQLWVCLSLNPTSSNSVFFSIHTSIMWIVVGVSSEITTQFLGCMYLLQKRFDPQTSQTLESKAKTEPKFIIMANKMYTFLFCRHSIPNNVTTTTTVSTQTVYFLCTNIQEAVHDCKFTVHCCCLKYQVQQRPAISILLFSSPRLLLV